MLIFPNYYTTWRIRFQFSLLEIYLGIIILDAFKHYQKQTEALTTWSYQWSLSLIPDRCSGYSFAPP